jgi:16S rRNA (uracil1498-N3)-methyltransferase
VGLSPPVFGCAPLPTGDEFSLAGPEGRHAALVRRLRAGERLDVTDGRGSVAECVVARARRDELDCRVLRRRTESAPAPRLVVVQALPKGDRGERAVEMLTEVGVDEIVPWAAARSVVRWDGGRGDRSRLRWRSTAVEAAKQARRAHWPDVAEPATTADVAARLSGAGLPVVLHEKAALPVRALLGARELLAAAGPGGSGRAGVAARGDGRGGAAAVADVVLVVGPEGGLADDELAAFAAAGARAVRLGPTVLRTSTAGVVAAAVVLAGVGRWDG